VSSERLENRTPDFLRQINLTLASVCELHPDDEVTDIAGINDGIVHHDHPSIVINPV